MWPKNHYFFLKNAPMLHSITIAKLLVVSKQLTRPYIHTCTPWNPHSYADFLDIYALIPECSGHLKTGDDDYVLYLLLCNFPLMSLVHCIKYARIRVFSKKTRILAYYKQCVYYGECPLFLDVFKYYYTLYSSTWKMI